MVKMRAARRGRDTIERAAWDVDCVADAQPVKLFPTMSYNAAWKRECDDDDAE